MKIPVTCRNCWTRKACFGLPAKIQDTELHYHLINSLPERIAVQIKLLPKVNFMETICKAWELCLIHSRTNSTESVNPFYHTEEDTRLKLMGATLLNLSEQLLALNTRCQDLPQCFNCGKLGYVAKNCRARRIPPMTIICFKCGNSGHVAHNCRNQQQGNGQGGTPTRRAVDIPWQWWVLA